MVRWGTTKIGNPSPKSGRLETRIALEAPNFRMSASKACRIPTLDFASFTARRSFMVTCMVWDICGHQCSVVTELWASVQQFWKTRELEPQPAIHLWSRIKWINEETVSLPKTHSWLVGSCFFEGMLPMNPCNSNFESNSPGIPQPGAPTNCKGKWIK